MFDYIGIDWGSKKCGIALGDSKTRLVTPHAVIATIHLLDYLANLIEKKPTIKVCILGENRAFGGGATHNSIQSEELKQELEQEFNGLKVLLYNERGTTSAYGKKHDQYAASQILALYFQYQLKD